MFGGEGHVCFQTKSASEIGDDELTSAEKLKICQAALSDSKAREIKLEQENRDLVMEIYVANEGVKANIKEKIASRRKSEHSD